MFLKFKNGQFYSVIYNNGKKIWKQTGTSDRKKAEEIGKRLEIEVKGEARQKIRIIGEDVELPQGIITELNYLCKTFPNTARSRVIEHIFIEGLRQVQLDIFINPKSGRDAMLAAMRCLHELSLIRK